MGRKKRAPRGPSKIDKNYWAGQERIFHHPLFEPLFLRIHVHRNPQNNLCPTGGWAIVTSDGTIYVNPEKPASPDEWVYILAHCALHLAFDQIHPQKDSLEWNTACDCIIAKFISELKIARPPERIESGLFFSLKTEEKLLGEFETRGIPLDLQYYGTAGPGKKDMLFTDYAYDDWWSNHKKIDWRELFSKGLVNAVNGAVAAASGKSGALPGKKTKALLAKEWFISSFPLLGALSAAFSIVEDVEVCRRLEITVAAVDDESGEIFINPGAGLCDDEYRFVMAHELLHVGLRHRTRRRGRDPYYWNIACDYVINGWLVEMGVGELPRFGTLYDPELKGLSAEAVYDRIVTDLRRYRKLATFRGFSLGDILDRKAAETALPDAGVDLDEFYRRALSQGLVYHQENGRGLLPAGLIEEIRALNQPPIPWDVELAKWFDNYFAPVEKARTYARPSRRQSSTPDIPRPRWVVRDGALDGRTFGVVLDTSGSMDRKLLAKALGAIASYSISRDVPAVRVVFCDAAAYDQGYMSPEDIAGRVKIRGRGGTVLQPGINLLEKAEDFPAKGPLLIITDGECDRLKIRREHAFIIPRGSSLPFVAKGDVFRVE